MASPVLSNIYLHKLDEFVETVLIPEYTRGQRRARNPHYRQVEREMVRARRRGDRAGVKSLYRQLHGLPSKDPGDPGYRRLRYCRYADDTLLGFVGPKAEAEQIKSRLTTFLRDELVLSLSPDKTLITHARSQRAKFLGYEITVVNSNRRTLRRSATDRPNRRSLNGTVVLHVPASVIKAKATPYLAGGKPASRTPIVNEADYTIVGGFGAQYRGIVEYYLLASDVFRLDRVRRVMEVSMLKTLAHKHRSSVSKMAARFKAKIDTPHGPRRCFEASVQRAGRTPLVARFGGIPLKRRRTAVLTDRVLTGPVYPYKELITRLLKGRCEVCQSTDSISVHHVRSLAALAKTSQPQPEWAQVMAKRRRKSLVVCSDCHNSIHGQAASPAHAVTRWRAGCFGNGHVRFGGRPCGKGPAIHWHLAARPTQHSVQDVDPCVAEFAEASRRHQRRVTRTKQGRVVVSILALVCALMARVAFWQRNAIARQRSAISRQYDTAVFNQVLGAADARQPSDPSLSAQLSMVAHHLRPNGQTRSRLLATQNAPLATQLTGHRNEVSSVMFSPDGNLLASASWDNTIRLWDTSDPNNPQPVGQPLQGHTSLVSSVAFSPDGKTLASSSRDKTVRLWDLETPTNVKELTAPLTGAGALYLVAFRPDGRTLAAASDDRTVRLWDVTNRHAPHAGPILSGHTGPVWAVAFSPNGHILASASNDRSVRLWDVADPAHAQQAGPPLTGFTDTAYAVAFDPSSSLLAATGEDGVIRLWNVTDAAHPIRVADPLPAHNEAAWFLEFSLDGTILASASYDGTAKLWNLLDPSHPVALGQPLADSNGGLTWVTFHPGAQYLATSGTSGSISLWTLPTGVIPNHAGRINSPAFSADGTVMVTASDSMVQLWTNAGHLTRAATLHLPDSSQGGYGYEARVDPGGHTLATQFSSASTVLWDISDITKPIELSTLPNTAKYNTTIIAFSPEGSTIATAGDDSTVQLWDITEPRRPQRLSEPLTGFTDFIKAVTFSPDGRTVFAGSADRTVRSWDIANRDHRPPKSPATPAQSCL